MKKNLNKYLLIIIIYLIPVAVYATERNNSGELLPIIAMELFCSIHMSAFVFIPLSKLLATGENQKSLFWKMFIARGVLLFILNYIYPNIAFIDFLAIFIGAFIVVPLTSFIKKGKNIASASNNGSVITSSSPAQTIPSIEQTPKPVISSQIKCPKCGAEIAYGNKHCPKCGESLTNATVVAEKVLTADAKDGTPFNKSSYDPSFFKDEIENLLFLITSELNKDELNKKATLPAIDKKKNVLTIIYAIITIITATIYFAYHNKVAIFIFLIMTFLYVILRKETSITSYLLQEVKNRPSEKISYIIASTMSSKNIDKTKNIIIRVGVLSITFLLIGKVFLTPHLIYEKTDDGYSVRYYTLGIIKKDTNLVIPAEHKGKPVVGIRGNVFKNVTTIRRVTLPDTIKEIRGGAFQYCKNLYSINLPKGIKEVKGNTFEGCINLKRIDIPNGVTRIGGSAFRDCSSLENVSIPPTVREIGSSAFRNTSVRKVCISKDTYINERAFKGMIVSRVYYEDGCVYNHSNNEWSGDDYDYGY